MGPVTMLDAMLRSASVAGGRGVRFHSSPRESVRRTYYELDKTARSDSVALLARGFRPGDRALLIYGPGLGFLRAVYAAMYAGLVPVPVAEAASDENTRETMRRIFADSAARLILCGNQETRLVDGLGRDSQVVILGDQDQADPCAWVHPGTTAAHTALLQYTSGSTGTPKGVIVTHDNLIANQRAIRELARHDRESVLVGWLPHFHDMGFGMYMQPIFGGFELVTTSPSQFLRRPILWLDLIDRYRGTTTVGPDFAYRLCAQLIPEQKVRELDLSTLRSAITGAEPVRVSTLDLFTKRFAPAGFSGTSFTPAYGMAETTLLVTASTQPPATRVLHVDSERLAVGEVVEADPESGRALASCGRPTRDHEVVIVDPATTLRCADSCVGEIWVSGPSVTAGYFGNAEETAKVYGWRLEGDPVSYLRTGDLGFLRAGELYVTGRLKDLIILRGRNLYPSDLENWARARVPGRREKQAAAFEWGIDGVALVIEAETEETIDFDWLRRQLAAEFSIDRLTLAVVRRGAIPRTTSGKVQRRATCTALESGKLVAVEAIGPGASSISLDTRTESARDLAVR